MGGCVSSRPEFPNSVHPNVFTVYPVTRPASADAIETSSISGTANIGGKNNATGQLEVTSNELILHRRGHEPVHWPLQYVRRYGYENHLFSFESGRRCESGPGIFTFRCRRAHELFLLVQANVQEARSPPANSSGPQPPQHAASLDNAVAALERARSGSMPSQFRFAGARGRGEQATNMRAEERTPMLADRNVPPEPNSLVTAIQKETEAKSDVQNRDPSEVQNPDVDTGQVFVEVIPNVDKSRHLSQERQRMNSARSQVSSGTSDHSLSSTDKQQSHSSSIRRRPISFEFGLSPMSSSQDGGDSSAFVSPRDDHAVPNATTPTTPPSTAYYVNVDPTQVYHNKLLAGVRRAPARTQSLGSTSSTISDPHPHHFSDPTTDDHSYMNTLQANAGSQSPSPNILKKAHDQEKPPESGGPLDYVTIDVGGPKRMTGHSTWTSSIPSALYKRYHKRQSSHGRISNGLPTSISSNVVCGGRSLTSVAEVGNNQIPRKYSNEEQGNGLTDPDHLTTPVVNPASSNYARIDCTRTKALRETAAAAQMQRRSTSCSASSTEANDNQVPIHNVAPKKHINGPSLGFGRKKYHSGDLMR